jgi:regulator of sigma E protease
MNIIAFFIVLAILILTHELGHFLAAKKVGAKVEEFGLGFPPRLWSFKKGETVYSINWIPFGGFVKILGENGDRETLDMETQGADRSLSSKSRLAQAFVLVAGVSFNILLAWLILSVSLMIGLPTSRESSLNYPLDNQQLIITDVQKNSPAELAGIKGGDIIGFVSDEKNKIEQPSVLAVQTFVSGHTDKVITVGRQTKINGVSSTSEIKIIPKISASNNNQAVIGVSLSEVGVLRLPWYLAIVEGLHLSLLVLWSIVVALFSLLVGLFHGQTAVLASVTGPVGLVGAIGSSLSLGVSYVLNLMAIISLNLAVINLLPLPALDGGRIFILIIEAIRRKALNQKFINSLNTVGFLALIALMLVLTYRDVLHLF